MIKKIINNKFFKGTILLTIGAIITKLLGFIIKLIITRKIGTTGVGLYSMLGPTMGLLTTVAIFSFPTSISKLIASNKDSKKIIISIIPISIIINSIIIITIILISPFISNNLLNNKDLYYPIICISLTLPFIGLSSIIKGYFIGKQNLIPYIISNIGEQIVRFILIIIFIPYFIKINLIITICFIILINIISEFVSIIIMCIYIPNKERIFINKIKIDTSSIKEILEISIPSTSSKILGSIFYFLEPIVLTYVLLNTGYTKEFIITEYGILNGYVLPLLLIPNFFTMSISTLLIPEVSANYSKGNYSVVKKRIKQITSTSLIVGSIFTLTIYLFPSFFLNLLYSTNEGINYIKILSPFIILCFIESPLINSMQAMGLSKITMKISLISGLIKISSIFILSNLNIGLNGLILSIIISLIITTYLLLIEIKKALD